MKQKTHKSQEKMDITYEEFFNPPPSIPHRGLVRLVRELEQTIGKEKAHEIVVRTAEKLAVEGIKKGIEEEPVNSFEDFIRGRSSRGPISSHATSEELLEATSNTLVFNMTECLWAKTWKELNASDIGYLWNCKPDFAVVQAIHPRLKLKRTKTLMQGDDCCDFTYYWEE